jgi:superfamily II DNA or RNA helicase
VVTTRNSGGATAASSRSKHNGAAGSAGATNNLALFPVEQVTGGGVKKIGERYYQIDAVRAICTGLAAGGRGQLRSACGTGKTVMAQRSAELLCPSGGVVIVVCPSVALVAQTLREWEATSENYIALAVCADETVVDAVVTVDELPAAATTSPAEVATWLRTKVTVGLRLIVGTHRSAHVIGEGLQRAGVVAELLVVDEAHRSAGPVDKHTALVHDDQALPAKRRLYATATPKVIGDALARRARTLTKRMIGMNNTAVFGPVLYNYPFSRAIEDGYLDDYRLLVMGVTRREIADHLAGIPRGATTGKLSTSLHTLMVQTVLSKAARQFNLRRVLTFCRRLNEAADFARTMPATLSALPATMRPNLPLTTAFVHGGMKSEEREGRLAYLTEPPHDGWTVVTNVRCLGEGVDVPRIDGVAFTYPKQSITEIVQAVGRALRRDPNGTGTATILVPVLLPDDPADVDELDIDDYRLLWQVVRALRAHDDKLGMAIDRASPSHKDGKTIYDVKPLEHILIDLPDGYDDGTFLQHLTARIVTSARSPWWDGFAALREFHAEHGHCAVRADHVTDDGYKLGAWAENTRASYRQGRLADERVEALDELDFDFLPRAVEWAAGIRAATAFHTEHGHLEPVRTLRVEGVHLRAWLDKQRAQAAAGKLEAARRAVLDALGMRWHDEPHTVEDYIAALRSYHARHGHIDIAPNPDTADGRLGSWLVSARIKRKTKALTAEHIAALDELGMRWTPRLVPRPTFQSAPM